MSASARTVSGPTWNCDTYLLPRDPDGRRSFAVGVRHWVCMTVHDPPLPVLAPVDVGCAQDVFAPLAVRNDHLALVPDGVREIRAGAGGDQVKLIGLGSAEPRGHFTEAGLD